VFAHNNVSAKSAHDLRIPVSITSLLAKENRTRNRWRLFLRFGEPIRMSILRVCHNGALAEPLNKMAV
jgi:hypothetical protein